VTSRFPPIILATPCLLAFAPSASAECAWVLWAQYNVGGNQGP
jgi:hypothetical protein